MKRLPLVILLVWVLVAVVMGCSGAHRYDARLVVADSLMQPAPDRALAIVEALPIDSLTDEGDRAYRDLLLTQSRYRCYITATSDSGINRALAYYRAHSGEREKLTRAYIYKGAVMEELGHPDSAMYYYKHAEATAAPDDYFNLGYCNLRIAELYQTEFFLDNDSDAINRLHVAKHSFEVLNDTNYMIVASGILGAINGINKPDSANYYFKQAILLAQQYCPSLQYTYKSKLSGIYMYQKEYQKAKELAMDVFRNGREFCEENQYLFYAALAYLKTGKIDSAKYISKHFPESRDLIDSVNYCNLMAEIAKVDNNMNQYGKYIALSKDITSRIILAQKGSAVSQAETEFNKNLLEKKHEKSNKQNLFLYSIAVILLVILTVAIIEFVRITKNFEKEKDLLKQEFESTLRELNDSLDNKNTASVSELVKYRLSAIEELYQEIRFRIKDGGKTKKVVPLTSVLLSMNEKFEMMEVRPSESFWKKMRLSVDGEYNNIVSFVEEHYPGLTEQDIRIFCLLCANVTPQIIKLCMNFSNVRSVSNYRNKLTKKKMGLDMTLDEFINAYMRGDLD